MIKNLIFDFGGVIIQLNHARAVEAFRRLGLAEADKILDKYHQRGICLDLETGRMSAEEYLAELSRMCSRPLSWDEVEDAWLAFIEPVSVRLLDFIASLRPRYRVYLLSNTNPFVMNWARSPRLSAAHLPLDNYFDHLFLSYQMGVAKPDRAIYEQMTASAGFLPEESVFVDDSETNLAASRALGFRTFCPRPEEGVDWIERFAAWLES